MSYWELFHGFRSQFEIVNSCPPQWFSEGRRAQFEMSEAVFRIA
jgi:hypothetical protein